MPENDELQPLAQLEERILETVHQIKAAREAKVRAEEKAAVLQEKVAALEAERRQILQRVEKLLSQIDTLAQG
jgi:chromosome segregation ATPase